MIIGRLSLSDALYHDAEHTALVTLVAQDILRGRRLRQNITADTWLHVILAALTHDIGYVRGVCPGDDAASCVVNREGATVDLPRGASDAFLAPYHVERSKIAVRARFANHDLVDAERIASAIELTRFPVPEDGDHAEIDSEVAFVRAVIAPLHSVSDQKAVETDTESRLRSAAPEAVRIGGCRHTSRILRENSLSRGTAKSRKARILIGRNRLAV